MRGRRRVSSSSSWRVQARRESRDTAMCSSCCALLRRTTVNVTFFSVVASWFIGGYRTADLVSGWRAQYAVGQASAQPVSLVDLYPTLLEYSGTPAPKNALDGQSLLPLLRAPQTKTGRAVISTVDRIHFSVRDERWRYLRYGDGGEELYDLLADPNEWTNLAGKSEHAATRTRLAAELPRDPAPPFVAAPRKKK